MAFMLLTARKTVAAMGFSMLSMIPTIVAKKTLKKEPFSRNFHVRYSNFVSCRGILTCWRFELQSQGLINKRDKTMSDGQSVCTADITNGSGNGSQLGDQIRPALNQPDSGRTPNSASTVPYHQAKSAHGLVDLALEFKGKEVSEAPLLPGAASPQLVRGLFSIRDEMNTALSWKPTQGDLSGIITTANDRLKDPGLRFVNVEGNIYLGEKGADGTFRYAATISGQAPAEGTIDFHSQAQTAQERDCTKSASDTQESAAAISVIKNLLLNPSSLPANGAPFDYHNHERQREMAADSFGLNASSTWQDLESGIPQVMRARLKDQFPTQEQGHEIDNLSGIDLASRYEDMLSSLHNRSDAAGLLGTNPDDMGALGSDRGVKALADARRALGLPPSDPDRPGDWWYDTWAGIRERAHTELGERSQAMSQSRLGENQLNELKQKVGVEESILKSSLGNVDDERVRAYIAERLDLINPERPSHPWPPSWSQLNNKIVANQEYNTDFKLWDRTLKWPYTSFPGMKSSIGDRIDQLDAWASARLGNQF
jgi:hypothetical protein